MKSIFISLSLLAFGMAIADDNEHVGVRSMDELEFCNCPEFEEKAGCFKCDCSSVYPNSNHWIVDLSAVDHSLEIEDGSVWKVSSIDTDRIQNWVPRDPVVITQNRNWFSSENYRIVNTNAHSSVTASLSLKPIIGGKYSLQISDIDPRNGFLTLSDHSHWKISLRDYSLLPQWALGDDIILGVNSGWDMSCPIILINCAIDNFIRAKRY